MSEFNLEAAFEVIDATDWPPQGKQNWKAILRALCSKKEEVTYSIGDRFLHREGEEYILAASGAMHALLVCLDDGGHWSMPTAVANPSCVGHTEFNAICGGEAHKFTRIEKP